MSKGYFSSENQASFRTAIAVIISLVIAFALHVDTPYWTGISVLVVANVYLANIIDKSILRIAGTFIGAWVGYFIAGMVTNSLYLFLLSAFLCIGFGMYYFLLSRYAYAFLLGGITALMVIGQLAFSPSNAFIIAIWRPFDISLGVIVSAAVAYCVFPYFIHDKVSLQLQSLFESFQTEFSLLGERLLHACADESVIQHHLTLKSDVKKMIQISTLLHRETKLNKEKIRQFRVLQDFFYELIVSCNYFILRNTVPQATSFLPLEPLIAAIKTDLTQIWQNYNHSTAIAALKTREALENLDTWYVTSNPTSEVKTAYFKVRHFFKRILQSLDEALVKLSTEDPTSLSDSKHDPYLSMAEQLRYDKSVIIQCLRLGLAAIIALLFWMLTQWPGGLMGIISSFVISMKKNMFEMKQAALHRFLGCIIGGGIALTALALLAMNLYDFLIIVFFTIWGAMYFSFKFPKYSYIGLQVGVALLITLAQHGGPPAELSPPLERLAGIFIGIFSSYIAAHAFWRIDPISQLKENTNKLNSLLRYNMKTILSENQGRIKVHPLTNQIWACRELIEAFNHEPISKRTAEKLKEINIYFENLLAIHSHVSTILLSIDKQDAQQCAEVLHLDLQPIEASILDTSSSREESILKLNEISEQIQQQPVNTISHEQITNLITYLHILEFLLTHPMPARM